MRKLQLAMLGVSVLGFIDATYLSVKHFTDTVIPCSLTHGCEIVTTSSYATPFGIPVALLGSFYYLALIVLLFASLEAKSERLFLVATRLTAVGLLASAWFVYVQVSVLGAICQWCMISAATSGVLFVLGYVIAPRILHRP